MATQTTVKLIDDIDQSEATETVTFGIDGALYEIDLSDKNADKLRRAVDRFVLNGRQVKESTDRSKPVTEQRHSREYLAAVRNWARKQGHDVSTRGRIPAPILAEFDAAHRGRTR